MLKSYRLIGRINEEIGAKISRHIWQLVKIGGGGESKWGPSLCLLFTFICWHDWPVTTAAKSRQTWLASGEEEGGRVDAQKCKHFIPDTTEKGSFPSALDSKSQSVFWVTPKATTFFKDSTRNCPFWRQWRRLGRKLKPTMMKWCLLCLQLFPPNHHPQLLTRVKTP